MYSLGISEFKPTKGVDDKIRFEECGVTETSSFFGFCQKHDRDLFSCFEIEPFVCSQKQLAMLYFRALSREYYAKLTQLESTVRMEEIREIHSIPAEVQIEPSDEKVFYKLSTNTAFREIDELKQRIDSILRTGDYQRIVSRVFEIESLFPVACAGLTNPDFDFEGRLIQDLSDLDFPSHVLSFSVIPQSNSSWVIFSYLDEHSDVIEKLISSLLSRPDIPADLIWMTFCYFENAAYSPEWIESIPDETLSEFRRAAQSNVNRVDSNFSILSDRKVEIPGFRLNQTFKI